MLKVTSVRVERLQDITEEDARAWTGDLAAVMPEFEDDLRAARDGLSLAEAGRLLPALMARNNAQAEEEASNRAMCVAFIIATCARWAEVGRAELGDIDFAAGQVHLRGSKTKRATRTVPLTRLTYDAMTLVALEAERWGWSKGKLFRPWTNVIRDLGVACRQAGVPRITPNDLRRTFGSWLRAAGAPLDAIAMAMGHADSRMVERVYGRLTTAELKRLLTERLMGETPANQRRSSLLLTEGESDEHR